MPKVKADKQAAKFIRDHVEFKLIQAGFSPEKACDMVSLVPESEITEMYEEEAGPKKMGGLGDGKILKWLSENKETLKNVADKVFSLLSLFSTKKPAEDESE